MGKNAFRAASARISMAERARNLFLAKNFPADVRPELLEDVIQDSGFHLRSKVQSRLTQVPLLRRIISGGQTRFQCIAYHLGGVEARASRICLGDKGTGYRIARAVEKPSLPHGVIARVLVCDRGDN